MKVDVGRRHLDDGFFPSRWTRTTDRERRYLTAIADTGEEHPRSGDVAERMGSTTTAISDVRDTACSTIRVLRAGFRTHTIQEFPSGPRPRPNTCAVAGRRGCSQGMSSAADERRRRVSRVGLTRSAPWTATTHERYLSSHFLQLDSYYWVSPLSLLDLFVTGPATALNRAFPFQQPYGK